MAKKLYVGNLSYNMTEDDLRETFGKIGEVLSAKIIMDNETGRSKGFGFVEMANDEDGDKAIASLNGTSVLDRTITVNEARPQKERPRSGFGGGGGGRGRSGGGGFGGGRKNSSWR
jgi:RNA recognition motif-containing protein